METIMRGVKQAGRGVLALAAAMAITGCGGGSGGGMVPMQQISVSLSASTVVVPQGGMPAYLQINIKSTSETALVSFEALPAGVKVTYAASDTNPSGLLTFTATASASTGTTMPIIMVNSANQTAMVKFTLIVSAKSMTGAIYQPST